MFADNVSNAGAAILALAFGVLILQRLLSSHTVMRYSMMPVAVSAFAAAIGIGAGVSGFLVSHHGAVGAAGVVEAVSLLAIPISFAVAGFRTQLTYVRTTTRMLALPPGSTLRKGIEAVASALEEPGLELCVYDSAAQAWVNDRLPLITPDDRYVFEALSPTGDRIAVSYVRSIDYENIPPGLLRLALTLAARAIFSVPQGAQEKVNSEPEGFLGHADRRRLERNIHDGVQRHLISMLAALQREPDASSEDRMTALTKSLREDVKAALRDLRALSNGETGSVLHGRDLASALNEAATASPFYVDLRILLSARLPPRTEENVFLLICEALTNAAKHAKCESVRIELTCRDFVLIEVYDDGVGGLAPGGARTLRERAEAHGGNLTVLPPTPEWRTRFVVTLPVA
jgi:signal transduction histidine kinase